MVAVLSPTSDTPPTFTPLPPTLTEDEIDDLLYFSRVGELQDLKDTVSALSKQHNRYELEIIAAAVDSESGNSCLHMAAANGYESIVGYVLSLQAPPPPGGVPIELGLLGTIKTATTVEDGEKEGTGELPVTPAPQSALFQPSEYLSTLVNLQNTYSKNSPLHWACLNGHLEVVKLLMENGGGDPGLLNTAGHDCVYEAEVNDKNEVVSWVLKFAGGLEETVGRNEGLDEDEKGNGEEVLKNEGSRHVERTAVEKEEGSVVAEGLQKLDLEENDTIR